MKDGEKFVGLLCVVLLIVTTVLTWVLMDADERILSRLDDLERQAAILTENQSALAGVVGALEPAPTPAPIATPRPPQWPCGFCRPDVILAPGGVTLHEAEWCATYARHEMWACVYMFAENSNP